MSSTTNVQNLLVNVFRPSYQYRTLPTPNYYVQLEISNVETVYANVIDTQNLRVSDANSNVYVGREAGNAYTDLRDCFSNTTLGYGAGRSLSNTDRGIYIGFNAGTNASNASNVIAIGNDASGQGISNIYIGNGTGGIDGLSNNLFLGNGLTAGGGVNNRLLIGSGTDPSGALISGNFLTRRVGILTSNPVTYPVEIADYTFISNGLGINADPKEHSLNLNGDCRMEDGFGLFTFDQNQLTSNSTMTFWSYTAGKAGLVQFGQTALSNPVYMGINTPGVDASYNLDISGSVRIRDLSGNSVTVENSRVNSVEGYSSVVGTFSLAPAGTSNIGLLKKGGTRITVIGNEPSSMYIGNWVYNGTTSAADGFPTTSGAGISVYPTGITNITVSNSTAGSVDYGYNITYFPVP